MSFSSENIHSRYPLKDSSNYGNFLELTPSKSKNQLASALAITQNTPPESMSTLNKSTTTFETPIKYVDFDSVSLMESTSNVMMKSSYLSPAFSSPTQKIDRSTDRSSSENQLHSSPIKKPLKKSKPKDSNKSSGSSSSSSGSSFDLSSEEKPPYSYATLIGISILSQPEKKLTLSHIYQWISDTFKYYKKGDVGWQNSIRHNLSLNKAFVKGEKSKDGKGHFWCIKEGAEEQFLKSRSVKKGSYQEVMDQINQAAKINAANAAAAAAAAAEAEAANAIANDSVVNGADKNEDEENKQSKAVSKKQSSTNLASSPNYRTLKRKLDDTVDDDDDDDDDEDEAIDDGAYDADEDLTVIDPPMKKIRVDIDNLGAPWQSTSIDYTNIGTSNPIAHLLTTTPKAAASSPRFVIDSPNKPMLAGKHLTYTSSFSCTSNFELSPSRPIETGPLLEPLTPANNISRHLQSQQLHMVLKSRTPKSSVIKTPIRNIRTPQTNSIIKKLWNSPSYLDDFYYSPLINNPINLLAAPSQSKLSTVTGSFSSYDDDDMILRNFEHPHVHSSPILGSSSDRFIHKDGDVPSCKNLLEDLKKVEKTGDSKN